jgi:membrane protease YdiL (CAAX protease family)
MEVHRIGSWGGRVGVYPHAATIGNFIILTFAKENVMTVIVGIVYGLAMLVFFIVFLIIWIRSRKEVRIYTKYGARAGVILIVFEILILLSIGIGAWSLTSLLIAIVGDGIAFVRIMAYTIVGIYMCTLLGYHSFPLLASKMELSKNNHNNDASDMYLGTSESPEAEQRSAVVGSESAAQFEKHDIALQTTEVDQQQFAPPRINIRSYVAVTIATVVCAIIYSVVLFLLTSPEISDSVVQKFGENMFSTESSFSLPGLLILLEAAFAEEIAFRLGIQNYLAKQFNWRGEKYWIAIILTSTLWTIAHTGILEPNWVKLVQIFPIGLALGWLFRKQGTESCILAHMFFNATMLVLSPYLM